MDCSGNLPHPHRRGLALLECELLCKTCNQIYFDFIYRHRCIQGLGSLFLRIQIHIHRTLLPIGCA